MHQLPKMLCTLAGNQSEENIPLQQMSTNLQDFPKWRHPCSGLCLVLMGNGKGTLNWHYLITYICLLSCSQTILDQNVQNGNAKLYFACTVQVPKNWVDVLEVPVCVCGTTSTETDKIMIILTPAMQAFP